ncbi:EVE domain-containing protein [Aureimonas sp. AU40]|uniref:EVE domain-containing protein n=1 Tax=Aureimonas sp. AU40 TaxID=1637747 RepID=UPI0007834212|nr:EVE domain-containing protein [Aureimonas sp. AU40]
MAFWLFKSEPFKWSFAQQKDCGAAGTEWTGVRNYQARNFMRSMQIGERGFFYHSNEGKAVVGVVEVCALAHPDSTADDPRWECVDIRAVCDMPNPVGLDAVKSESRLKDMVLATNSRLSVQPVTEAEFGVICEMGGLDPALALG